MYDTTFNIIQSPTDGKTANFVDTTTISSYSDIKVTRFLFGNFLLSNNPQTLFDGDVMEQYREYRSLTPEAFIYDNKTVGISGDFIPFISSIVVQPDSQMQTTGRYGAPTTFLPTINYTPRILVPEDFGVEPDNEKFPDMVYSLTYEQYIDNSPLTPTTVVSGKQYIVYGSGVTATYNGNIYRQGEVFIAGDNGAISFTNSGTVKVLAGIRFSYFAFVYNIQRMLAELQIWMYRNNIQDDNLTFRISVMYNNLDAVLTSSIQDYTSPSVNQEIINDITSELQEIFKKLEIC